MLTRALDHGQKMVHPRNNHAQTVRGEFRFWLKAEPFPNSASGQERKFSFSFLIKCVCRIEFWPCYSLSLDFLQRNSEDISMKRLRKGISKKPFFVVNLLFITMFCFTALAKDVLQPSGYEQSTAPANKTEAANRGNTVDSEPLEAGDLIGSFLVGDGQYWGDNPPTYSCLEACAEVFGGSAENYFCSTSDSGVNHLAWASTWGGDPNHCASGTPVSESFKLGTDYNCGSTGCSISAYVMDWCEDGVNGTSMNFCYASAPAEPVPSLRGWSLLAMILMFGLIGFAIRHRKHA